MSLSDFYKITIHSEETIVFCFGLRVQFIMTILIIALAISRIIENRVDTLNPTMGLRYGMGFNHPNRIGIISFQIVCLILYCYKEKNNEIYCVGIVRYIYFFNSKIKDSFYNGTYCDFFVPFERIFEC